MSNTKQIEEKALNCLKTFVEDSDFISQYLADNDKEPCWDGHLYLYSDRIKSKEHLIGRVPVQVKGTEVNDIKIKDWKYKLDKTDLKAYLHEPTFYIVCQINKKTNEKKLFYREFLPAMVKKLLRDMGENKTRMTKFKPLTENLKDFEDQLILFRKNSIKMISYADKAALTIKQAMDKGMKTFSFDSKHSVNHV